MFCRIFEITSKSITFYIVTYTNKKSLYIFYIMKNHEGPVSLTTEMNVSLASYISAELFNPRFQSFLLKFELKKKEVYIKKIQCVACNRYLIAIQTIPFMFSGDVVPNMPLGPRASEVARESQCS